MSAQPDVVRIVAYMIVVQVSSVTTTKTVSMLHSKLLNEVLPKSGSSRWMHASVSWQ